MACKHVRRDDLPYGSPSEAKTVFQRTTKVPIVSTDVGGMFRNRAFFAPFLTMREAACADRIRRSTIAVAVKEGNLPAVIRKGRGGKQVVLLHQKESSTSDAPRVLQKEDLRNELPCKKLTRNQDTTLDADETTSWEISNTANGFPDAWGTRLPRCFKFQALIAPWHVVAVFPAKIWQEIGRELDCMACDSVRRDVHLHASPSPETRMSERTPKIPIAFTEVGEAFRDRELFAPFQDVGCSLSCQNLAGKRSGIVSDVLLICTRRHSCLRSRPQRRKKNVPKSKEIP